MSLLLLPETPLRPGDLLAGNATLAGLRPGEEVELRLIVSRQVHRPFSNEPSSRWIAFERTWRERATAGGDGFAFALRLPRREELADLPAVRGWLHRLLARLLHITVGPLEWELVIRPAAARGPVDEVRGRIAITADDGDEQRGAA